MEDWEAAIDPETMNQKVDLLHLRDDTRLEFRLVWQDDDFLILKF